MGEPLSQSRSVPDDWQAYRSLMLATSDHSVDVLKPFYMPDFEYLDQCLGDAQLLALDIETTGLNAREDKIVSIGVVEFDLGRIYLNTARHWLVDPGALNDSSVVVHGITHSDVCDAPSLEHILPEVINCMAGKLVVVHYRDMEREFFRALSNELWGSPWLFPVLDTFDLEYRFVSEAQNFFQKLSKKPLPSLRLPDARQRYGLPSYENHNALIDAIATAELLQAQSQRRQLQDERIPELIV